jgi:ubiquinone/menaquinone biosynthesis C-methylase UbiE
MSSQGARQMWSSVKGQMKTTAKQLLPARLQRNFPYSLFGRKIGDSLESRARKKLFGTLAPLVPRIEDMFDGPRNLKLFKADGEDFLRIYKDICRLGPSETMLDVGCGIGRKTIPLTNYLTSEARYEGIDISKKGIEWCRNKISKQFRNFQFKQIDVYNKFYNPNGKCRAADYRFPFSDDSFDFVMLGSVFTHMFPDDAAHYLSEVYRVLRRGGRCLVTYFLLTEQSLTALASGESTMDFKHSLTNCRVVLSEMPEYAVAFDQAWLEEVYPRIRLRIGRLDYGSWYGRKGSLSFQDLVLAVKD